VPTVSDEIAKLFELHKAGAITREEFEAQKRKLLEGPADTGTGPVSEPSLATEIGAYRLLGLIGEGGMGAVHRGRHRSTTLAERQGGDVAVKVMHPQYARDPDYRARFEQEAALGLKLDHPGIVRVHDLLIDGGNLALVMDLVHGRSLDSQIGQVVGPIPWDRAWPLLAKLLDAVGYAHENGVVHRDLKPENILVTPEGEPRIIDFGIAKDVDGTGTRTGTGMGTVEYMAPEQYTDAKIVDARADLYSLGMILYEMLAGRLPWEPDAPQFEILEQKARRQLISPSVYCASIPSEMVAALAPALGANPVDRYASAAGFSTALRDAQTKAAARETAPQRPAQPRPQPVATPVGPPLDPATSTPVPAAPPPGSLSSTAFVPSRSTPAVAPESNDAPKSRPTRPPRRSRLGRRILIAVGLGIGLLMAVLLAVGIGIAVVTSTPTADVRQLEWVRIPSGSITLETTAETEDDGLLSYKTVELSSFKMSETEVTTGQWAECVQDGECGWPESRYSACNSDRSGPKKGRHDHPMNCVTWNEAADFADWAGGGLPTEAQWEYAARGGGGRTAYHNGGDSTDLDRAGWYSANGEETTHAVAQKTANRWGLYDMHGNVSEWSADDWHGNYDGMPSGGRVWKDSPRDASRVVRGGGYGSSADGCRSDHRAGGLADNPVASRGFRVVKPAPRY